MSQVEREHGLEVVHQCLWPVVVNALEHVTENISGLLDQTGRVRFVHRLGETLQLDYFKSTQLDVHFEAWILFAGLLESKRIKDNTANTVKVQKPSAHLMLEIVQEGVNETAVVVKDT